MLFNLMYSLEIGRSISGQDQYLVRTSYMQIYNEKISDLLVLVYLQLLSWYYKNSIKFSVIHMYILVYTVCMCLNAHYVFSVLFCPRIRPEKI